MQVYGYLWFIIDYGGEEGHNVHIQCTKNVLGFPKVTNEF